MGLAVGESCKFDVRGRTKEQRMTRVQLIIRVVFVASYLTGHWLELALVLQLDLVLVPELVPHLETEWQ